MKINEGDLVYYRDSSGDKLKGTVIHIYTSLMGFKCVKINNFYLTRFITEVDKV